MQISIITDTMGAEELLKFIEQYNQNTDIPIEYRIGGRPDFSPIGIFGDPSGSMRKYAHVIDAHLAEHSVIHLASDWANLDRPHDFGRRRELDSDYAAHLIGLLEATNEDFLHSVHRHREGLVLNPRYLEEPKPFKLYNYLADLEFPDIELPERSESSFKHWWTPNEQSKERRKDKSVIWVKARAKAKRAKQARKQHRRK